MSDRSADVTNDLPIDAVLPQVVAAVRDTGLCVLQAPPGAGKTTKVPLALRDVVAGRIVMLEPRRVAARASAERMAQMLGEAVGATVGYRIRGEARISPQTRIEVVTEGVLTRWLQADPELPGIGALIFDEFHERSLISDLGLALALESRALIRPDLVLVAMSATLNAGPVADLMGGAPVVTSDGRAFDVATQWLATPRGPRSDFIRDMRDLVLRAMAEAPGGCLVFLPGAGEIQRLTTALQGQVAATIQPLFGAMSIDAQRAAIAPGGAARKLVLATAIAETSLTIPDIRIVVDGGRARRARYDPGSGMTRLVTERVSRAEADQRRGRAGRVAPGCCYRLWTKGEEGALALDPPPEIETADLAGLALDLAAWGADPGDLAFLTRPPAGAFAEAQALLATLGAVDGAGRITAHGRALARLPLHPRLGHMLIHAGRDAASVAAILSAAPLRVEGVSLSARLAALANPSPAQRGPVAAIRAEAKRLARLVGPGRASGSGAQAGSDATAELTAGIDTRSGLRSGAATGAATGVRLGAAMGAATGVGPSIGPGVGVSSSPAEMLALAYPDRIGLHRPGDDPRWILSGGKGARMDPADPMAGARLVVAADLDGDAREARIRLAEPINEADLRALFAAQIEQHRLCVWDKRSRRVVARIQDRLGAVVLADQVWQNVDPDQLARAALDGVRDLGLPETRASALFLARVRAVGIDGFDPEVLMDTAQDWLLPYLRGVRSAADLAGFDPLPALQARLGWEDQQRLDRDAPAHFATPLGHKAAIDYASDPPGITVRLQELFGLSTHPSILRGSVALKLTLLSPARRPIAVTSDLPGFWDGSYAEVRKDMRGQYPRHPWPEDPRAADPTLRAKPRR